MPLRGGKITSPSVNIALNARAVPGTFHWGLLIMDTEVEGTFHHATNPSGGWEYEARKEYPEQSIMLVAMVRVGNLSGTVSAAVEVIQSIPPDVRPSKRTSETFDCMVWLKDTIAALDASRVVQLPMSLDSLFRVAHDCGAKHLADAELGHGAYVENDPTDGALIDIADSRTAPA